MSCALYIPPVERLSLSACRALRSFEATPFPTARGGAQGAARRTQPIFARPRRFRPLWRNRAGSPAATTRIIDRSLPSGTRACFLFFHNVRHCTRRVPPNENSPLLSCNLILSLTFTSVLLLIAISKKEISYISLS